MSKNTFITVMMYVIISLIVYVKYTRLNLMLLLSFDNNLTHCYPFTN